MRPQLVTTTVLAALGVHITAAVDYAARGVALYHEMPDCAKPCHDSASAAIGCGVTDLACLCRKQEAYADRVKGCVMSACWIFDSLKVKSVAERACVGVGVRDEL